MNHYLLHGKLEAKQSHRDELANILLEASKLVSMAKGCQLYVVGIDDKDDQSVYIAEIWDSKEDHDNSLKIDGIKEIITKAMPLLDSQPKKGQEIKIIGGLDI